MANENQTAEAAPKKDAMALMYPSNQLKPQVRDFTETLSAFKVMKEAFFEAQ